MNEKLYTYGYLLTNDYDIKNHNIGLNWDNWSEDKIGKYTLYVEKKETKWIHQTDTNEYLVFVGHAYNPFDMLSDEQAILSKLAHYYRENTKYRQYFDQITGVFTYFVIKDDTIIASSDCAGMMSAYYGVINHKTYLSSHAQLIAELTGLQEDPYITSLKKSRTFHLYGLYLPYNLSPYKEIKRIIPNVEVMIEGLCVDLNRFYPRKPYTIEEDYESLVQKVARLLHNNLVLISQKWEHPAISLTGGTDSKTTLACASDVQDRFLYYSYISLPREATDAYAAKEICDQLGLKHEIYNIDTNQSDLPLFNEINALIERHYGYLGKKSTNEVCKRIGLIEKFHSDIEVKSWVSEIARASRYTKYNKEKLPDKMTPRMLTSMYKIFTYDRWNAVRTDRVFEQYIRETKLKSRIEKTLYPWSEFFVWEIVFGGWGGLALSCEHKISNNITVPYNNRAIIDLMLRTPLEKRRSDQLHRDIMDCMDTRVNRLGIHVVNGNETKKREIFEGLYFDLHSRIPF